MPLPTNGNTKTVITYTMIGTIPSRTNTPRLGELGWLLSFIVDANAGKPVTTPNNVENTHPRGVRHAPAQPIDSEALIVSGMISLS